MACIGTERRADDAALVAGQNPQLMAALGIPQARRPVTQGDDDATAIGIPGGTRDY
jgi:hypothetical protein